MVKELTSEHKWLFFKIILGTFILMKNQTITFHHLLQESTELIQLVCTDIFETNELLSTFFHEKQILNSDFQ